MKTVKVTNVSDVEYHGYDHGVEVEGLGLPPGVDIEPGETADVSETKAAQLSAEHPDWFKVEGVKRSGKAATTADDDES